MVPNNYLGTHKSTQASLTRYDMGVGAPYLMYIWEIHGF